MSYMVLRRLRRLGEAVREEEGQALVEYALLLSLIALVAFVGVEAFGQGVAKLYSHIVAVYPHD